MFVYLTVFPYGIIVVGVTIIITILFFVIIIVVLLKCYYTVCVKMFYRAMNKNVSYTM